MTPDEHDAAIIAKCREFLSASMKRNELLAEIIDSFEAQNSWEDSYGVPGSEWPVCEICKAEGKPGIFANGIPHEEGCKVLEAKRIAACAGPAEAGWLSTIIAIEDYIDQRDLSEENNDTDAVRHWNERLAAIRAAWPIELLNPL